LVGSSTRRRPCFTRALTVIDIAERRLAPLPGTAESVRSHSRAQRSWGKKIQKGLGRPHKSPATRRAATVSMGTWSTAKTSASHEMFTATSAFEKVDPAARGCDAPQAQFNY
jgi:hypothetical protein